MGNVNVKAKNEKPESCRECCLNDTGVGFVPDKSVDNPALIVIGEAPGRTEVAQGVPFVGQSGFVLKSWLLRAVPDLQYLADAGRVYFGNTLRCLPPKERQEGRAYPTGVIRTRAEACCRQYNEWRTVGRKSDIPVVLLGEVPQRYWFREELADEDRRDRKAGREVKGVWGRVGRVLDRDGRKWILAPHPSAILRDPRLVEHGQIALKIASVEVRAGQAMAPRLSIPVVRDAEQIEHILVNYHGDVSIDLEWGKDGKISIVGFAWWDEGQIRAGAYSREGNDERTRAILQNTRPQMEGRNGGNSQAAQGRLVGHNILSADLPKLQAEGLLLDSKTRRLDASLSAFDTMLGLHTTHAHLAGTGSYDLRSLVLLYGHTGGRSQEWFPLDWKRYDEDIWETCALDAAAALYCARPLKERIRTDNLEPTVSISHQVAPIFVEMGQRGVRLDMQVLSQIHREREAQVAGLRASLPTVLPTTPPIAATALLPNQDPLDAVESERLNPRSPKVLAYIQEKYRIVLPDRSRATWEKVRSSPKYPKELRELADTCWQLSRAGSDSTWIGDATDDEAGLSFSKLDKGGFVYPQYNVVGTPDRPSCTGVNIQNFPRPGEDPRAVPLRAAVIPPEDGMVLISVDYQAVETYTNAVEANDWEMVKAIKEGRRGHQQTADYINATFGLALTRQQGKTCNHSVDKGESAGNLAVRLFGKRGRREMQSAQSILDAMLSPYPETKRFRAELWKQCVQNNPYVAINKFGRRLNCFARSKYKAGEEEEYRGRSREEQAARERWKAALAFLGRSSAVDCLLRVMSKVYYEDRLNGFSLPYIEIHDELVYAMPNTKSDRGARILQETFQESIPELEDLSIPCEVKTTRNWTEAK